MGEKKVKDSINILAYPATHMSHDDDPNPHGIGLFRGIITVSFAFPARENAKYDNVSMCVWPFGTKIRN